MSPIYIELLKGFFTLAAVALGGSQSFHACERRSQKPKEHQLKTNGTRSTKIAV